jgi:tetratricopeptide (TPR) repeat protein
MSSSSFTPRASTQSLLAVTLATLWAIVLFLGAMCVVQPRWLVDLSRPGKVAESRQLKEYGDRYLQLARREPDRRRVAELLAPAVTNYLKALEVRPDYVDARINLCLAEVIANRDTAAAIATLEELLAEDGDRTSDIEFNLAQLHAQQGEPEAALEHLAAAEQAGMAREEVVKLRAQLHLQRGEVAQARAAFEAALREQNRLDRSYLAMVRRTLEIRGDDPVHGPVLRQILAGGVSPADLARYDLELLRREREHDPEIAKTHNQLGALKANAGELSAAAEHFRHSLRIWPGNPDAARLLPRLEAELRRLDEEQR